MGKGSRYERQLVNKLHDAGYGVMRIPASGGATSKALPDVFANIEGQLFAWELKFTSSKWASFDRNEMRELIDFAERWDANAEAVARFSGDTNFYRKDAKDFRLIKENGDSDETETMKKDSSDEYNTVEDVCDYVFE